MKLSELKTNREDLQLTSYVPLAQKEAILEDEGGLVEICLDTKENGLKFINAYAKEMVLSLTLVQLYTNIELEDQNDEGNQVDEIIKSGVVGTILKEVADARRFSDIFDYRLKQEIELANTLPAVVANGLSRIVAKIPDDINAKTIDKWIKTLPKVFDKMQKEDKELVMAGMGLKKE